MSLQTSLLAGGEPSPSEKRTRLLLFLAWLALIAWFLSDHAFWRDEVRAFSLALSGSNLVEMLRAVHGEGHPALWYLILRAAHDIVPVREVLPVAGAVIGIAAMAVFTRFSPFRPIVIALALFSFWAAFEYVVVARNYGISALVMFALAALYPRVRNSLWFGVILAVLCNTNVPSCFLAAMFLLFRLIELVTDAEKARPRDWLVFLGNGVLSLVGALLCFAVIYPTYNDAAVSANYGRQTIATLVAGLFDDSGFSELGFGFVLLLCCCAGLVRKPAALCVAVLALIVFKLFFYLVYPSSYRHEVLYLAFLLSLYWMVAEGAGGRWGEPRWMGLVERGGSLFMVALLAAQSWHLLSPITVQLMHVPFSQSENAGRLLQRPELRNAIVMADPDVLLEPIPYYADNRLWFMRQQRFGTVVKLSNDARHLLTLDDVLADAERLHRQTGRPIVFLSLLRITPDLRLRQNMMYKDDTIVTPESARRFLSSTRRIATLRPAGIGEQYDVYLYPR